MGHGIGHSIARTNRFYSGTAIPALALTKDSQTNILCKGNNTGVIVVSASGGTEPYQYKIDSGSYGSSGTFSTLLAGSHRIYVKDAANDVVYIDVILTEPATALDSTFANIDVLLGGQAEAWAEITGLGGTAPYTYNKESGAYQSSGMFTGLAAGTYMFHVKDANGCIKNQSVTIEEPDPLTITSIETNDDGSIIRVYTNKILDENTAGTEFTYKLNGGSAQNTLGVEEITETYFSLFANDQAQYGDVVTLSLPAGYPVYADDGGLLSPFTNHAVTNNVPDPQFDLVSATIESNGTDFTLVFNTDLSNFDDTSGNIVIIVNTVTLPLGKLGINEADETIITGSFDEVVIFPEDVARIDLQTAFAVARDERPFKGYTGNMTNNSTAT